MINKLMNRICKKIQKYFNRSYCIQYVSILSKDNFDYDVVINSNRYLLKEKYIHWLIEHMLERRHEIKNMNFVSYANIDFLEKYDFNNLQCIYTNSNIFKNDKLYELIEIEVHELNDPTFIPNKLKRLIISGRAYFSSEEKLNNFIYVCKNLEYVQMHAYINNFYYKYIFIDNKIK